MSDENAQVRFSADKELVDRAKRYAKELGLPTYSALYQIAFGYGMKMFDTIMTSVEAKQFGERSSAEGARESLGGAMETMQEAVVLPEATREAMREMQEAMVLSEATREVLRNMQEAVVLPEATREAMREVKEAMVLSEATREAFRNMQEAVRLDMMGKVSGLGEEEQEEQEE